MDVPFLVASGVFAESTRDGDPDTALPMEIVPVAPLSEAGFKTGALQLGYQIANLRRYQSSV